MKRCAGGIEYELTRKAVKNLNLRLRPDGSVTVSIPKRVTLAEADRFVEQNADRIRQARQRLDCRPEYLQIPAEYQDGDRFWLFGVPYRLRLGATGEITLRGGELSLPFPAPLSSRDPRLTRWLNRQLEPVLREMIAGLVPRLAAFCPHRPGELRLRLMTSRWGSCNPRTGELHFSTRLAHLPPEAIEGVAAHELAHLAVPNHSAAFYAATERLLPDYPRRQAMLRPPVHPTPKELA